MVLDHRYQQFEKLRSTLSVIIYPLHVLADIPATGGRWLAETLVSRDSLRSANTVLREENLKLHSELQLFEALRAENERLRDLLGSSYKIGNRVLVAELSAVDLDPFRQEVIVKKGSTSGVYEGQAVLDASAVMGQVTHVNPFYATVLLITDAKHSLPVQVLRNGLRTIATGTGQINRLEIPYLPNNADIETGDLLVTSGLGKKFPPGYPVAEVVEVSREPGKPFASILAEPLAKLDRSREVLLVWEINMQPYDTTPVQKEDSVVTETVDAPGSERNHQGGED